jgi:hypothetical protein
MTNTEANSRIIRPHYAVSTDLHANVHLVFSRQAGMLTTALLHGFMSHRKNADIRRSHMFNGRYENIYLTSQHIPQITDLLDQACNHASRILGIDDLQAGCWFNHMPPGAVTTLHSHDDDDELLSAVFYVSAPPDSGKLIIHADNNQYSITPQQGLFVFFAPDMVHEVSENTSATDRLSIGINFGTRKRADS